MTSVLLQLTPLSTQCRQPRVYLIIVPLTLTTPSVFVLVTWFSVYLVMTHIFLYPNVAQELRATLPLQWHAYRHSTSHVQVLTSIKATTNLDPSPSWNSAVNVPGIILSNIMSSATEVEITAVSINCKECLAIRQASVVKH